MATPLAGSGSAFPVLPEANPADPSPFHPLQPPPSAPANPILQNPILIFLLFQKAIRSELERLHRAALVLATQGTGDVRTLSKEYRFISAIYRHHCNAEDEVIFPALDARVKNIARTYSLEHMGENDLFGHLFDLLNSNSQSDDVFHRELASCTGAILTSVCQHMSKEEEQVFPLLAEKFPFEEQAALVWQFICSIPVNMMAQFFPWLSSSLSPMEQQDMLTCLHNVVPEEKLLQQVVFAWMKGKSSTTHEHLGKDFLISSCLDLQQGKLVNLSDNDNCSCEISRIGKRKLLPSEPSVNLEGTHPINGVLHWHNAIRKELSYIVEETKRMRYSRDFSELSTFHGKLRFIADVCIFHGIAEDHVLFQAMDAEISFVQDHTEEKRQFKNFKSFTERILKTGLHSNSGDFYLVLCSHADQIVDTMHKHFKDEETKALPLARLHFTPKKQQQLIYESMRVMPLKLLEHVLPWLISSMSVDDAKFFLQNMQSAAPASDLALVTLLSGWACRGNPQELCKPGSFFCPCLKENRASHSESPNFRELSTLQLDHVQRPAKRSSTAQLHGNQSVSSCADDKASSSNNHLCCVPALGVKVDSVGIGPNVSIKPSYSLSYDSMLQRPPEPLSCKFPAPFSSSLFLWETDVSPTKCSNITNPIDCIFKFHSAVRKDLEYLDVESGKLIGCDEAFLQQFTGRFHLLQGLYRAHCNAEDGVVFPALESKKALQNVSHSYTIDHKQELMLFQDISTSLSKLCQIHERLRNAMADSITSARCLESCTKRYNELAMVLQGMCKSLRVSLDQHVYLEELELWPLFEKYFSTEDQDKIVGQIIGRTGAEVLQSMLPWVTSALTQEEQDKMMDTWRQATKNTMFDEWLNEWWKGSPASTSQVLTEINTVSEGIEAKDNHGNNDQLFKPGWKDIFRMNQSELESEIRKVSRDTTLDPRRKAYLIQNLMTSNWLAAQQKSPQSSTEGNHGNNSVSACFPSYRDPENRIYGCKHYKRNCKIVAACCNKLFTCRFCHDEVSDHSMDRRATTEMMCMRCLRIQPIGSNCKTPSCNGYSMAKYFCHICKFFDDERTVYHCPFCNLCRVGKGLGIDFFHCMKCNCCLGMKLLDHKCREKVLETNCPICCDFLFTSSAYVKALPCGHLMHSACFQAYTCSHYTCPICCKSLGDMAVYFGMLDALLAAEQLPEEYVNRCQDILCNDCDKKGTSRFHWLYHKCTFCGSYNTKVI